MVTNTHAGDSVWFERRSRPKTYKAICKLGNRMSRREIESIPLEITVFAPSPTCHGATGFHYSTLGEQKRVFVYLSPRLEEMSQAEVDSVVAHEFAHIALGHVGSCAGADPGGPLDKDADRLVRAWGFSAAYRSKREGGKQQ
jgi:hypothetical protein